MPAKKSIDKASATTRLIYVLSDRHKKVRIAVLSPDGRKLASSSDDKTIELYDTQTGEPLHKLTGHSAIIINIAWSPDGRLLASGGNDRTIKVWDADRG